MFVPAQKKGPRRLRGTVGALWSPIRNTRGTKIIHRNELCKKNLKIIKKKGKQIIKLYDIIIYTIVPAIKKVPRRLRGTVGAFQKPIRNTRINTHVNIIIGRLNCKFFFL